MRYAPCSLPSAPSKTEEPQKLKSKERRPSPAKTEEPRKLKSKERPQKPMIEKMDAVQYDNCPICSSFIKLWRVKETNYGGFKIDRCSSCGYAFVNPRPSMEFLMEYYSSSGHGHELIENDITLSSILEQERQFPNSTIDAKRIIKTIKSLNSSKAQKRFLDIGCGYGFFSMEALASGFDVVAIELASIERQIAEEMTNIRPILTAFEDFEHVNNDFSAILTSQILEHAHDINLWISKACLLLQDNGILAVALPNFESIFRFLMQDREPYICPPAHLNFFSPKSLSLLLERNGFKVQEIQSVSRIPPKAFEKRFSKLGNAGLAIINNLSVSTLKIIDKLHLGMMINIYARKVTA